MKRRGALIAIAAAAGWVAGCSDAPKPQSGGRWPVLSVRDLAGQSLKLPAASATPRVINVWALWCPPCRRELPSLERLAHALEPQGIEVSTVALEEDNFRVREYLAQHAGRLPSVLMAPGAPIVRELGINTLPQTFFIAADGTVLARWIGAREWDEPGVRQQVHAVLRRT